MDPGFAPGFGGRWKRRLLSLPVALAHFLMLTWAGLAPGTGGGNSDTIAEFAAAVLDKDPAGYDRVRHALRIAGLAE